jgi:hypothetical protein
MGQLLGKSKWEKPLADWIMATRVSLPVMSFVIMKQNEWRGMMNSDESHSSDQV